MLKKQLEQIFFPFIEKPGRYIGGEIGIIHKDIPDSIKVALAYPDLYEVGMSYFGGRILYHLLNQQDKVVCERVYAPAIDAEELMREKDIPLFSLESHRPINEFDLVGFTLSYEMIYTNMLNMLDLAGIPLLASERDDSHPLISGGGPICYNPEPIADFFDFIFVGEVEESLSPIIDSIRTTKGMNRQERLLKLAQIQSVYVPSFYDAESHQPLLDGVPEKIIPSHVHELKPEYYPEQPLIPLTEIVHDRVAVEIMRGCPQGCRFCQAGKIYKPVRVRNADSIKKQVINNLKVTGYDEVGLLSLSSADYPDIKDLTLSLANELKKQQVALSFPSLRPASFTKNIAEAAGKLHKTGLTLAPEVGTDRMRQAVNKNITEEDLLNACQIAFQQGWQTIKLYFMIGLPTETDEDIEGIIDLIMKVVRLSRGNRGQRRINVTISPFSPKAHTPFQWDEICSPDEITRKQNLLKTGIRAREINLKFRNPRLSYLEGILGRGDRKTGRVILTAYKKGARFDGWSEHFNPDIWYAAFEENDLNLEELAGAISFSKSLPWDIIAAGSSKERLQHERSKSSKDASETNLKQAVELPNPKIDSDSNMYGRRKKKIVSPNKDISPIRGKIRLKWGKTGLVRFLSHLENNRIFERAIRRAQLPVVYSQGFHPHQKLSFGPPLPLGYSSDEEYLDIHIEGSCTKTHIDNMAQTLPKGYSIKEYKLIYSKAPAISTLLNRATYRVTGDFGDLDVLKDKIDNILNCDSVIAFRSTKDGGKEVEIRPAIYHLEPIETNKETVIEMELGLGEGGYAKPSELIECLNLYDSQQISAFHFHRAAIRYKDNQGTYLDPLSAIL